MFGDDLPSYSPRIALIAITNEYPIRSSDKERGESAPMLPGSTDVIEYRARRIRRISWERSLNDYLNVKTKPEYKDRQYASRKKVCNVRL